MSRDQDMDLDEGFKALKISVEKLNHPIDFPRDRRNRDRAGRNRTNRDRADRGRTDEMDRRNWDRTDDRAQRDERERLNYMDEKYNYRERQRYGYERIDNRNRLDNIECKNKLNFCPNCGVRLRIIVEFD